MVGNTLICGLACVLGRLYSVPKLGFGLIGGVYTYIRVSLPPLLDRRSANREYTIWQVVASSI